MRKIIIRRVNNLNTRLVLLILVGVAVASILVSALSNPTGLNNEWWSGFTQNFSTEIFGAIVTFILIEVIIGNRQNKERLITQLRSEDRATVHNAINELKANGWLYDGSLETRNLYSASLSDTNLTWANLAKIDLSGADLVNAILREANLESACLVNANLAGANLQEANLAGANLMEANLIGCRVSLMDLPLVERNRLLMMGTERSANAKFDINTTLPDFTK